MKRKTKYIVAACMFWLPPVSVAFLISAKRQKTKLEPYFDTPVVQYVDGKLYVAPDGQTPLQDMSIYI